VAIIGSALAVNTRVKASSQACIGHSMRHAAALMRGELAVALTPHRITYAQWLTLMRAHDTPNLTPRVACRGLLYDTGAFTRLVDQLEDRGLIRRVRNATDRREIHLRLTVNGRRLLEDLAPIVNECLAAALDDFSAAEVALFSGLLDRMIGALERKLVGSPNIARRRPCR
jgi:DNA-binding MarR family transcriptional regulator